VTHRPCGVSNPIVQKKQAASMQPGYRTAAPRLNPWMREDPRRKEQERRGCGESDLLARWGTLHAVRSVLCAVALLLFLYLLIYLLISTKP
jgi:Domain of unknown function (DUF1772)